MKPNLPIKVIAQVTQVTQVTPLAQLTPINTHRRERHLGIEPVLSAIALLALVLLMAGWRPLAGSPSEHQGAPAGNGNVETASVGR
ncbi:MAG: hypothetical protein LH480_00790 [Rubrivivax sp.]|nr:hypothetical protein [Rubrivivax sp.]